MTEDTLRRKTVKEERYDIKMIALDLDRTTLDDSKGLTEETRKALEEAGRRGVMVVIATGRTFDALPDAVFSLDSVRYFICSNGATVFDARTKEMLKETCLDPEAVETMVGIVRDRGYMFESFTGGYAYIGRDFYEKVKDGMLDYRHREYVLETRNPVDDIFRFTLDHKERIENLNVFFPTQEEKEETRPLLEAIPNAVLTSSVPSNYELGGMGVSKGAALEYLIEKEGISKETLMAAGDSPNDLPMLKLAGLSVAVENAEPEVKEAVDYVAPSNNDDGVAEAVRRFVLR